MPDFEAIERAMLIVVSESGSFIISQWHILKQRNICYENFSPFLKTIIKMTLLTL
jgi:hypothetical protein